MAQHWSYLPISRSVIFGEKFLCHCVIIGSIFTTFLIANKSKNKKEYIYIYTYIHLYIYIYMYYIYMYIWNTQYHAWHARLVRWDIFNFWCTEKPQKFILIETCTCRSGSNAQAHYDRCQTHTKRWWVLAKFTTILRTFYFQVLARGDEINLQILGKEWSW